MRHAWWALVAISAWAQEPPAAPAPAAEAAPDPVQSPFHGSIEIGYRGRTAIGGSEDAYRNVVNLGEGVRVLGFSMAYSDRLSIEASGWGGDPDSMVALRAEKRGLYRLTGRYRNVAYFNRLPSFGLGLQSRDLRRRTVDTELQFLPGRAWTPYVAWSADGGTGRSVSNFVVDANEYAVGGNLRDRTDFFRAGVNGRIRAWMLTLEQGGSIFREDDSESTRDRNAGNRTTPIGGQRLELTALDRFWRTRGDAVSSRAAIAGSPLSWLDVSGSFLFTQPRTETAYQEDARGLFIDLDTFRFSNRILQFLPAEARQPRTSGTATVEIRPHSRFRIVESWWTDRFHSASSVSARLVGNWNQQQLEGFVDLGRGVTARGGWRRIWGDALARQPLLGGPGAAEVSSNAGLLGLTWKPAPRFDASADYEGTAGGRVLYAVGIQDSHRLRLRARATPVAPLVVTANASWLDGRNAAGRGDAKLTSSVASVAMVWTPPEKQRWSLTASYARSSMRTDSPFLIPQTFAAARSLYREDAHSWTGLAEYRTARAQVAAGGSAFVSSGSRPTRFWQPEARVVAPIAKGVAFKTEWKWYGLAEPFYAFEGFRTHVWQAGLVISR